MLFAFQVLEFTPLGIYAVLITVVACYLLGKALKRDERMEKELARRVQKLAGKLREEGFTLIPPIMDDFARSDWDRMHHDVEHAEAVAFDPPKLAADLAKLRDKMNKHALEDRKHGQQFLDDLVHEAAAYKLAPTGYVKAADAPKPAAA